MAKRNNPPRPSGRSGSNRYPGEPRRTDPYRYYDERDAGYRRSYTQPSGRTAERSRYYGDEYRRRTSAYSSGPDYSRERDYGYRAPQYEREYRQNRYESRYDNRYDSRYGGRPSDPGRRNPNRQASSGKRPAPGRGGKNDRNRRKKGRKRPVRLKKRFYFFIILLILLVAVGGFFGVRALVNNVIPGAMDKIHQATGSDKIDEDTEVKETGSGDRLSDYDSVTMEKMILDDLGTEDTQLKVINSEAVEEGDESGEGEGSGETVVDENTIDLAQLPMEERIRAAVLSSWYISPLGQNRATIEESFGVLNKYEKWAGGIYYHKGFPDSMYVRYKGKTGSDGMPGENAVCTEVSVALEQILQFEPFAPNEKFGTMHKDNGDYGWTDYYYSLLIQKGINLIIYCEDDGTVNQETHIIVRQVK